MSLANQLIFLRNQDVCARTTGCKKGFIVKISRFVTWERVTINAAIECCFQEIQYLQKSIETIFHVFVISKLDLDYC